MTLPKPTYPTDLTHDTFKRQLREIPAFRALLRAVEAQFYETVPLPHPILDLGCGDGHFATVAFDEQLDVGLDPWWGPLQEAQQQGRYQLLTHAVGERMPFPDAHFATVVSNSVLEHIPNVEPVIREVARVLQPGGWFHFCVPGPNFRRFLSVARGLDKLGAHQAAESYRKLFDFISRHRYYSDPTEWEARLARYGLRIERWWPYFSARALTALEWGHPLGLPSLLAKKLLGRWLVVPTDWNLALTYALLKRHYSESPPDEGAYLFFVARKPT